MSLTPKEVGQQFLALAEKLYAVIPEGKSPTTQQVKKLAYTSGFIAGIKDLVKKAFDLTLSDVLITNSGNKHYIDAAAGFIPDKRLKTETDEDFNRLWDFANTFTAPYVPSYDPSIWAIFVDLSHELKDIGFIKSKPLPLVRYMIHFGKSFFNRNDKGEFYYKPEEFTAVMLHELGHLKYYVTCGRTLIYTRDMFHYVVDLPVEKVNRDQIQHLITTCLENKELPVLLQKYGEILKSTNIDETDKSWSVYVAASKWFISSSLSVYSLKLFLDSGTKNEMDVGNPSLKSERAADNYAVAAGFGQYLVVALTRTLQTSNRVGIEDEISTVYPEAADVLLDCLITSWLTMSMEYESSGYDPIEVRLQKLISGSKRALDNPLMSPEEKAVLIVQVKRAERALNLYKSQRYVVLRHTFANVTKMILHVGLFIPRLFTSQLSDTGRFFNDISDDLKDNNLNYWAHTLPKTT